MQGLQNQAAWRSPFSSHKLYETNTFRRSIKQWSQKSENNFLNYQKVEFAAGHSIGYPSSWSLFIVSCGSVNQPKSFEAFNSVNANYLGLFLDQLQPVYEDKTAEEDSLEFIVRYLVEVLGTDDTVITSREVETTQRDNIGKGYWGWRKIAPICIEDSSCVDLRITFTIIGRRKETLTKIPSSHMNLLDRENDKEREIAMNIYNLALMGNITLPDVTLQTTYGNPYFVHKDILAARSAVFGRMFDIEMTEGTTRKARINEICCETMECLLHHIYTGQVETEWLQNPKIASELVYASEKYWLASLREFCDKNLVRAANRKNCLRLLELASLHDLEKATDDLTKYVQAKMSPPPPSKPTTIEYSVKEDVKINGHSGDENKT